MTTAEEGADLEMVAAHMQPSLEVLRFYRRKVTGFEKERADTLQRLADVEVSSGRRRLVETEGVEATCAQGSRHCARLRASPGSIACPCLINRRRTRAAPPPRPKPPPVRRSGGGRTRTRTGGGGWGGAGGRG
jgi:hypothetical protein